MYPDFLGIGAQKSGSTWIYRALDRHPQVEMLPLKEIHYFDLQKASNRYDYPMQDGVDKRRYYWKVRAKQGAASLKHAVQGLLSKNISRKEVEWHLRYALGRRSDQWYGRLFEPAPGCISGEITPAYGILTDSHVADVKNLVPKAKIIYIIRNPIDRSWSSAVNYLEETSISLVHARRLFNRPQSRMRDDYIGTIDRWIRYFGANQFFLCTLDEVRSDGAALLRRLASFLGIDPTLFGNGPDLYGRVITGRRSGTDVEMPVELRRYLCEENLPQLRELAGRLGWPATDWLAEAEAVVSQRTD